MCFFNVQLERHRASWTMFIDRWWQERACSSRLLNEVVEYCPLSAVRCPCMGSMRTHAENELVCLRYVTGVG